MVRTLLKKKTFSLINLLGLSIGLTVCLLLVLYIQNELGYDTFHEKHNRIYRLAMERKYPGRSTFFGEIPWSIADAVKQEFPEVVETARIMEVSGQNSFVTVNEKYFRESKIFGVDSNFFHVFTGDFLAGNKQDALTKPNTSVINESTALRLFGSVQNAMGKHFLREGFADFVITGVCRDWPEKSHFQFNFLLANSSFNFSPPNYYDLSIYTYLLLNEHADASALENKLPQIVTKYVAPKIQQGFGESFEDFTKQGNGYRYFLQPLKEIHLNSDLVDEFRPNGSKSIIYLLAGIGAFILFLACINFINLSTAISVERAKEVGIRKTFGSDKKSIVWQFLAEAVLFSVFAMIVSVISVRFLLPVFNRIADSTLSISFFYRPVTILCLFAFSVCVGILAGIYPALVISSFRPIVVLKGRFKTGTHGRALRNGLVVFQFAMSVFLMICTLVVSRQMHYVMGERAGNSKDHLISIGGLERLPNGGKSFIQDVSVLPGIEAWSSSILADGRKFNSVPMVSQETGESRTEQTAPVDEHYAGMMSLEIKEGRFFSKEFSTDSQAVVLNESAVQDFHLKHPVGSTITSTEPYFNGDTLHKTIYTVIGVIKDFHFQSMHEKISPLVLTNSNRFHVNELAIKINGKNIKSTMAAIENRWKQYSPVITMNYFFLDQKLAEQYKAEQSEQKIFTAFSVLAIMIACIGLFGLSVYTTIQRTKEIGVRKVLGAGPGSIVFILSKDFLKLVLISALIAFPVAWWAMHSWLQGFAYRVKPEWWIFILAGFSAALIAFISISFQAIKAAVANPVKSLRSE